MNIEFTDDFKNTIRNQGMILFSASIDNEIGVVFAISQEMHDIKIPDGKFVYGVKISHDESRCFYEDHPVTASYSES